MAIDMFIWDPALENDIPEFVALLARVLSRTEHTVDKFRWKHLRNPAGPSIVAYARDLHTGSVVAIRVFWRQHSLLGNRSILTFQPCDTATDPGFRGQGLFTHLTQLALQQAREEGATLVYNFPNPISRLGNLKLGWVDLVGMAVMVRPIRPGRILYHILQNRGRYGRFTPCPKYTQTEGCCPYIPHTMWHPIGENVLCGKRDQAFFRWRFLEHPTILYRVIEVQDFIAVVRIGRRGMLKELSIVEILSETRQSFARGIRSIADVAKTDYDADLITAVFSRDHEYCSLLAQHGFLKTHGHGNHVGLSLTSDVDIRTIKWRLSGCDIDTF